MDLLGVRQKFIELSGREDLASTTTGGQTHDTDAGADFFIMGGSRWLDLITERGQQEAEFSVELAVGSWFVNISHARTIREVWFVDSGGDRVQLEWQSEREMWGSYPAEGGTTNGTPAYWTKRIARSVPIQVGSGLSPEDMQVVIMPPCDEAITLAVYGVFHSFPLVENDDENYWSAVYPELLIFSALRQMEASYRNTQGVKDWEGAMDEALKGIDNDVANFMGNTPPQMEG